MQPMQSPVSPQPIPQQPMQQPPMPPVQRPVLTVDPAVAAEYAARAARRRAANFAAGGTLLYFGCSLFYTLAVLVFTLAAHGTALYDDVTDLLTDTTFSLLLNTVFQCLFIGLPFFLMLRASGHRVNGTLPYNRPRPGVLFPVFWIGLGGMMVSNFGSNALSAVLERLGIRAAGGVSIATGNGLGGFLMMLLTVAVVPALFEEFAYRGVVMGLLIPKLGTPAAIFISALLFGVMHGNLRQIPFAFLAGLALGWVRAYTGSMWPSMLIHFASNAFSVLTDEMSAVLPGAAATLIGTGMMMALALIGLVALLILLRRDPHPFTFAETGVPTLKKGVSAALGSPSVILALIAFGGQALFYQILGGIAL